MFRFKSLFLVGILLAAALMDKTYAYTRCTTDSDCYDSYKNYCCGKYNRVCKNSCVGTYCDRSTDCGHLDVCCRSGTCETCDISTGLTTWIVAVIVIGVLVVAVPVGIVICRCCVASASSTPVVVTQQNPATSVIAVQNSQMQSSGPAYIQNPATNCKLIPQQDHHHQPTILTTDYQR